METLIQNIIKDIKDSSKIFIFVFLLFFIALYTQAESEKKLTYSFNSQIIMTQPSAISSWASFNQGQFKQDLYHFIISLKIKNRVNEICDIKDSKQIVDMAFIRDGFQYINFSIFHNKTLKDECMNTIFNEIILKFYNNYLTKIINDNKILMNYMKNETLSVNSNLFLSTFQDSYRSPQLIQKIINKSLRSDDVNFTKIISISFIFSAFISLLMSSLQNKYKKKNKKGS